MSTVINIPIRGPLCTRCFTMSTIACADLGADCPYEAKGMDKKIVKEEFMSHMMENHKNMIDSMSEEEIKGVMEKIDEKLDEE